METLYLIDNGLYLKRRSQRIVVKKDGKNLREYHIHGLKRIVVFGNNQLTTELLRTLAAKGVDVAFLSGRSRYKFRLVSENSKNVYLRVAQNDRYRNDTFRLELARTLVRAKIRNQRALLVRYRRYRKDDGLHAVLARLKQLGTDAQSGADLDKTRGYEGIASRMYFAAFGLLLKHGFVFEKRLYRPSPDPVNAMLSFGYTLVTNELLGLLEAHGFDVHIGFLHGLRYGRASLATDLVEEFRAPLVDRLVLYLVNKGVVRVEHFHLSPKGEMRMKERTLKNFLKNYERFITAPFKEPGAERKTDFRSIFRRQVRRMEATLLDGRNYKPYAFY